MGHQPQSCVSWPGNENSAEYGIAVTHMPGGSLQNLELNVATGEFPGADHATVAALTVHSSLHEIEGEWRTLEAEAFCTVFQSFDWLSSWVETVMGHEAIEPAIIVGRNADGTPVFILPFQISRGGMADVLGWLAGQHSNYQTGLFAKGWLADLKPGRFTEIWNLALSALPHFDAVHFTNQPENWEGMQNPLAHLSGYPSANTSFLLRLKPDFDDLYKEKRSSATRRSARKRERRLAEVAPVEFREVKDRAELEQVLTTLFEQKIPHMEEIGVGDIFGPQFRSFLVRLGTSNTNPETLLVCHYLTSGSQTLATVIGAVFRGRYYGLLLSMTDGPLRRHSPGEIALRKTIEACCNAGLQTFDLSQGHAEYKLAWADDVIEQFDTIIGYTAAGRVYAVRERLALSMKRMIKETPKLWSIAQTMRRHLHGHKH